MCQIHTSGEGIIHITKDNYFVVSHDEDLSVSTTARGLVRNKNLSEVENVLVVKSAAIPENEATAKEAFIAAPLFPYTKLLTILSAIRDSKRLWLILNPIRMSGFIWRQNTISEI
jgi:hypothetical protein